MSDTYPHMRKQKVKQRRKRIRERVQDKAAKYQKHVQQEASANIATEEANRVTEEAARPEFTSNVVEIAGAISAKVTHRHTGLSIEYQTTTTEMSSANLVKWLTEFLQEEVERLDT